MKTSETRGRPARVGPRTTGLRAAWNTLLLLLLAGAVTAQGIQTKRGAMVLYGSPAVCSQPATVNYKKLQKSTPEWKTIRAEGVRKGSGRYELLITAMNKRIKEAATSVAEAEGCDCVVRKGDIKDAKGLKVEDMTKAVMQELESQAPSP